MHRMLHTYAHSHVSMHRIFSLARNRIKIYRFISSVGCFVCFSVSTAGLRLSLMTTWWEALGDVPLYNTAPSRKRDGASTQKKKKNMTSDTEKPTKKQKNKDRGESKTTTKKPRGNAR